MKKLMFAMAAVAFAVSAQAAITYTMSQAYKGSLDDSTKGYYSLYARAATDTAFGSTRAAIEKYFTDAVAAGTWDDAKAEWQDATTKPVTTAAGHEFATKTISGSTLSFDRALSEEQYNYFAVIFYQNGDTEAFRVVEATSKTNKNPVTIAEGTKGIWGEWKTVPEPTSGLLLLLGVAGLALKRRRA